MTVGELREALDGVEDWREVAIRIDEVATNIITIAKSRNVRVDFYGNDFTLCGGDE